MVSLLDDLSVFHHKDHIRLPDRGQPVRYDKRGPSFHQLCERCLDLKFCPCIDGRGRFVQDQHGRPAQHDSRDAEQLLLSLGQPAPVLCDPRIIALWQPSDKAVDMGSLCRCDDLFLSGVRPAHGDIIPDRPSLKPCILEYHAVPCPQAPACQVPDIDPLHLNAPRVYIVKPHEQIDQCRLPAACRSHDGDPLPRLHFQIKIPDQPLPRHIGK